MRKNFKSIFFLTLSLFVVLIMLNVLFKAQLNNDGWPAASIMFFFSFSCFQLAILEKNIIEGISFIKSYLFLTTMKMLFSALFIIIYGLLKGDEASVLFFIWFFILYLIYTYFIGLIFYKKQ